MPISDSFCTTCTDLLSSKLPFWKSAELSFTPTKKSLPTAARMAAYVSKRKRIRFPNCRLIGLCGGCSVREELVDEITVRGVNLYA